MSLTSFTSASALAPWLLDAVVLWIVIGLLGSALSARRGEQARVRRGLVTIVIVAIAYLGTLLAVSLRQPARMLGPGQSRCFGELCLSVVGAQELPGFQARDQTRARLIRVLIDLHNTSRTEVVGEPALSASLVDDRGHRWNFVPGLAGVSLSTRVQPGRTVVSDPIFRVPRDASGLHLELLHAGWYSGRLVISNPESLLHRSTIMQLPPTKDSQLPATNSAP